ncbi:MAG: MoaD/ThiS family protein [Limimaricola sp.]|uniref:MoaD/ThiS family protein n=1 Tax=Limimaricola sp. TaxID=2211665 RepID=UPI001D56758E|nr:MoaD/ThiS family protein [Limimaricola sp.]MBI1416009.1 MoaD/ThiS family protein [Limimaricola sp.]
MATIRFTANLSKHRDTPVITAAGTNVRAVIDEGLAADPLLKSYVLDEQGRLRKHVNIFVDGQMIADRAGLSDPVDPEAELYVMQALSGG